MLKRILLFSVFWIMFLVPKLFLAQSLPTFACPVTIGLLNEGPNLPEHDSYITIITPSTGEVGFQLPITDIVSGLPYKSLNGLGLLNSDGYAYAQYQRVATETEIITGLLAGNYTATSSLIKIGSNGNAQILGTLSPPVNAGYNAHVVLGLLGTANSTDYLTTAIEAQIDPITQTVSSYIFYIGKVAVPSAAVTWSQITLDANCTAFIDGVLRNLRAGQDAGAQDMVWDFNTNKLFLYAGIDKVLAIIDLNTNKSSCYSDNNGVLTTANLGGLALDSIGQMIGLEVQTGRVMRIDTRGCIDGNPATPCMNSVVPINNYTINGNIDTRGDAASCFAACTPPVITKANVITCVDKQTTIDINVTSATGPYTYVWGIYPNNGTLSNTASQDAGYINNATGTYKVYVTVSDNKGCQATDSINIQVISKPDTTKITANLCTGDSIVFGNDVIKTTGVFVRTIPAQTSCDSIIQLTVSSATNCGLLRTFTCPIVVGLLNEGPNLPEHDSYITVVSPSSGAVSNPIAVTDVNTGLPYKSLNGIGIVNTDGFAYAQYQPVPVEANVIAGLLAGNYTATSSFIQIGSNGKAQVLGTLSPPVNTGFNAHVVLGLLGSADNSGNYLTAALEAQVNPITQVVTAYKLYVGKIAVPNAAVIWNEISLDPNCTTFIDAVLANLRAGQQSGAQDMVWDFNTNKLLLYSGADKVLAVIDLNTNTSTCYTDNNGVQATANLGGLALDSIGQMIGLEVQTGRVFRIDTRGCIDGNPATPCMNSVDAINNYTLNGNIDTRGDAASCVAPCIAPVITKRNTLACVNTPKELSIGVSPQGNYTYVWGNYAGNGTLINTTTSTPIYVNGNAGNYKVYITVENETGCQKTDSFIVTVVNKPDTAFINQQLCTNKDDSIVFNGQIIKQAGTYLVLLPSFAGCDSLVKLTVTESICNTNPPVAVKDDTITFGTSIDINVLNNDYDIDGDSIFLCGIVTQPTHGTVTANQDGTITYIPNITSGIDSFQYKICSIDGDSTAWVIITIEDCMIPNTFSPNGDGKNDLFEIPCLDGKDGSLLVFNRWGAQVFKNEYYDNVTGVFDGKYKGEDLPDGTYYYVLKYNSLQGKKIDRSGFIVIHRSSN